MMHTMLCGHCGKPVIFGVGTGGQIYHEECAHGPGWTPGYFQPTQPPLSEDRVRELIRDELKRQNTPEGVSTG
jgi:hypothetical protein